MLLLREPPSSVKGWLRKVFKFTQCSPRRDEREQHDDTEKHRPEYETKMVVSFNYKVKLFHIFPVFAQAKLYQKADFFFSWKQQN